MLELEHQHQGGQYLDQEYAFEQNVHGLYNMSQYEQQEFLAKFHALPFSYHEKPSMFFSAPLQMKQDLHSTLEMPHSVSIPSIGSASSSTVGSPYSGPSHTMTSHDVRDGIPVFDRLNPLYGLGVLPTIINNNNNDAFTLDMYSLPPETEAVILSHDKLRDTFVGECADLSYLQSQSSTIAQYASPPVAPNAPDAPIRASGALRHISLAPSPVLTLDTSLNNGSPRGTSASASVASTSVVPYTLQSPTPPLFSTPTFKSPTTPASARRGHTNATRQSKTHQRSPSLTRTAHMNDQDFRNNNRHNTTPPLTRFQSHFFAQSSGNFVQPLETAYPSLIHPSRSFGDPSYTDGFFPSNVYSFPSLSPGASPALSPQPFTTLAPTQVSGAVANANFYPHQAQPSRRPSLVSYASHASAASRSSPASSDFDDEGRQKGRCPHPDCGKVFKDLKAHMLTHQAERPEKCPILTCEYNQKGFARKYDKNRHTLTHYKGTMVCGFCPGSGSPAEKSFNRADVFKRHLTSVHGVEQTPPNSRKRSPTSSNRKLSSYCQDATGKCSTCSQTFTNAQDFYEHLDDCVLRVVQQEEPSEAINARHLTAISGDNEVQETLDLHMIKTEDSSNVKAEDDDEEDEEDEDDDDDDDNEDEEDRSFNGRSGKGHLKTIKHPAHARAIIGAGVSKSKPGKKGMTWSKGGVALVGKGRKKRKHYPPSWGMAAEKMRMKKRVLCVYDGDRRLWKDDMMLHNEFEVRVNLADGKNYVTDLDVETMKRAIAFHNATEEEKGPWLSQPEDDIQGFDLNALMA